MHKEAQAVADGRSRGVSVRRALPLADALAEISGADRRPLLVLRECLTCNGTDDALMTRQADNERTLLMLRWFHCVKLPPDVLETDHPYHALFAGEEPGHLFLSRWDGSGRSDLSGQQSRTELWSLMEARLAGEYDKKVEGSLKQLLKTLDRFDTIDKEIQSLKEAIDDAVEEAGSSKKLAKLKNQLVSLESERAKARADAVKLSELELKNAKEASAPVKKTDQARKS